MERGIVALCELLVQACEAEKAATKGSIRNVEIESSLFDIYFKAIALLAEKVVATLFEYSSVSICDPMHASGKREIA